MTANARTTHPPPVLTSAGRARLGDRLYRMARRLEGLERELGTERSEDLLRERRQLTAQVEELTQLLREAVLPGALRDDPTIVEVGDEIEVELPDGSREVFLIVHPLEAGMDEHRTSSEAPVAMAVLGHRPGDRVTVRSPAGTYACTILRRDRIR